MCVRWVRLILMNDVFIRLCQEAELQTMRITPTASNIQKVTEHTCNIKHNNKKYYSKHDN